MKQRNLFDTFVLVGVDGKGGEARQIRTVASGWDRVHVAALTILFLSACSSLAVTTNFDRGYDFSHISTFSFGAPPRRDKAESTDVRLENSIAHRNLRDGIKETMGQMGITYQKDGGQVLVNYYVNMVNKKRPIDDYGWDYGYGMDYGYGYGYGPGWNYGYNFSPVSNEALLDARKYQEGTVIIDVVDAATKHLAWRGQGVRDISATADETALKIRKTVKTILAAFPPR